MGTVDLSRWVKQPEREVMNLPPSSAYNKNGALPIFALHAFMVWTGKILPCINT